MKNIKLGLFLFLVLLSRLVAQTWTYDFKTQGIDSTYWATTGDASFSYTFVNGTGVTIADGSTASGILNGSLQLKLSQFAPITGDFSMSATFTGASTPGSGINQVQLLALWPGATVVEVRSPPTDVNMWIGSVAGVTAVPAGEGTSAPATFTLTRVADVVTAKWNGADFWSASGYGSGALTEIDLMTQKNGTGDPVQVTWQSFSMTSAAVPEPSTYAVILGAGALGIVVFRRRSRA